MKEYHLHKDDIGALQIAVHDAGSYTKKNVAHCFIPHRHSFFQLIWFHSAGSHFVDYEEYQHQADSIYFLVSGQVHAFCEGSPNSGSLIHFNQLLFGDTTNATELMLLHLLTSEGDVPHSVLADDQKQLFSTLVSRMQTELSDRSQGYRASTYHALQMLLVEVMRNRRPASGDIVPDRHLAAIIRFKQLVVDNLGDNLPLTYYSRETGVSNKTLTSISKRYLDATPAHYIQSCKLLEAKRLLSNTKLSKQEIAYALGFDQATYFSKFFKKHTKMTPSEFVAHYL